MASLSSQFQRLSAKETGLIFFLTVMPIFCVAFLDVGIINAMPFIRQGLHINFAITSWIFFLYILFAAIVLAPFGRYADYFGRMNIYCIALVFFVIGNILLCIGTNIWLVLVGRAICGIATGGVLPLGPAIINASIPSKKINTFLIWWGTMVMLGVGIGIFFAGLFVSGASWRLLYWVTTPFIILALIIAYHLRRIETPAKNPIKIDYIGSTLLGIFLITLTLLFSEGQHWGWHSPAIITFYAVTPVSLLCLIIHLGQKKNPIIYYPLLKEVKFLSSCLIIFAINPIWIGLIYLYTLYTGSFIGLNYSPIVVGATFLPLSIIPSLFPFFSRYLLQWLSMESYLIIGGALILAATLTLQWVHPDTPYVNIWWRMVLAGAGLGIAWIFTLPIAMTNIPPEKSGAATSTFEIFRLIGTTAGAAIAVFTFHDIWDRGIKRALLTAHGPHTHQMLPWLTENKRLLSPENKAFLVHHPHLIQALKQASWQAFFNGMLVLVIYSAITLALACLIFGYEYYLRHTTQDN